MSTREVVAFSLLAVGVGVTVLASLALLRMPGVFARLHFTGPVTSVGAPLIAAALIVDQGTTLGSGLIAAAAVLLLVSGPAVTMAVARVEAQRRRGSGADEPE